MNYVIHGYETRDLWQMGAHTLSKSQARRCLLRASSELERKIPLSVFGTSGVRVVIPLQDPDEEPSPEFGIPWPLLHIGTMFGGFNIRGWEV